MTNSTKCHSVELWTNDRCQNYYSEDLGIRCVQEKGHDGEHKFYIQWNDWTK